MSFPEMTEMARQACHTATVVATCAVVALILVGRQSAARTGYKNVLLDVLRSFTPMVLLRFSCATGLIVV